MYKHLFIVYFTLRHDVALIYHHFVALAELQLAVFRAALMNCKDSQMWDVIFHSYTGRI